MGRRGEGAGRREETPASVFLLLLSKGSRCGEKMLSAGDERTQMGGSGKQILAIKQRAYFSISQNEGNLKANYVIHGFFLLPKVRGSRSPLPPRCKRDKYWR